MRTATLGKPTDDMRRLMDAVHATVDAMLETAWPGRTCHEVALAAKKAHALVADATYHLGISFPPTWAEELAFIAEGTEEPLAAGLTLHLPITYQISGDFGMAASETVLITDSGCERLTDLPRDIHVVTA
jgi:Xaa-Pro dipeptidase